MFCIACSISIDIDTHELNGPVVLLSCAILNLKWSAICIFSFANRRVSISVQAYIVLPKFMYIDDRPLFAFHG